MFPQSSGYEGPADSKAAWVISRKNGKEGRREKGSVARLSQSEPLSECVTNALRYFGSAVTFLLRRSENGRRDSNSTTVTGIVVTDAVNQGTNQGANQAEPTQQQQQQQQQQL
ncbi:hypothetical protein HZH68_013339 [Vespula germanica]|uniref:Uncharacterized protein n=1 Tax=Vespula germanica TaxID=30212 RepID=A0A834MUU5_VESGE|nr:hypothetical protein HZH68_013339 [Vespula germanica]